MIIAQCFYITNPTTVEICPVATPTPVSPFSLQQILKELEGAKLKTRNFHEARSANFSLVVKRAINRHAFLTLQQQHSSRFAKQPDEGISFNNSNYVLCVGLRNSCFQRRRIGKFLTCSMIVKTICAVPRKFVAFISLQAPSTSSKASASGDTTALSSVDLYREAIFNSTRTRREDCTPTHDAVTCEK